jgi:hypothetical protein
VFRRDRPSVSLHRRQQLGDTGAVDFLHPKKCRQGVPQHKR